MTQILQSDISLLQQVGGRASLRKVVALFCESVMNDQRFAGYRETLDSREFQQNQFTFFSELLAEPSETKGSTATWPGPNPTAHANKLVQHFSEALSAVKPATKVFEQIIGLVSPFFEGAVSSASGLSDVELGDVGETAQNINTEINMEKKGNVMESTRYTNGHDTETASAAPSLDAMSLIENAPSNIFCLNTDLAITYINATAKKTLEEMEKELSLSVEDVQDASLDIFVLDIKRVRKLLANPRNLPFTEKCEINEEVLELTFSAMFDTTGRYQGPMVTWEVATEKVREEAAKMDRAGQLSAVSKVMAVIEFNLDGTIITANENFLTTVGYPLSEIQGQHHGMFVDDEYRRSSEYKEFWSKLNRGEYQTAEYKRLGKGGKEVWIQASYNPIMDKNGKPFKVVKYATDVTQQKLNRAETEGQLQAVSKAMAVIEFNLEGTIQKANENFLATLGYSLPEIQGKHHSMFVEENEKRSAEYKEFWAKLNRGEYQTAEYKRIGKGGVEVWIQASYNPIFDLNNKPYKVVKYATNITDQVKRRQGVELAVKKVDETCQLLASCAQELTATSDQMTGNADETSNQANVVSAAAE